MNINDLTLGQIREIQALLPPSAITPDHPYPVGSNVFIRTVTLYYTGKLVRVHPGELVITDAAWVADTGRFHVALMTGTLNEIEPFPDGEVIVPRSGLIDVCRWNHPLPRDVK